MRALDDHFAHHTRRKSHRKSLTLSQTPKQANAVIQRPTQVALCGLLAELELQEARRRIGRVVEGARLESKLV